MSFYDYLEDMYLSNTASVWNILIYPDTSRLFCYYIILDIFLVFITNYATNKMNKLQPLEISWQFRRHGY